MKFNVDQHRLEELSVSIIPFKCIFSYLSQKIIISCVIDQQSKTCPGRFAKHSVFMLARQTSRGCAGALPQEVGH